MSAGDAPPTPEREGTSDESLLTRVRTAERGPLFVVREVVTSVLTVAAIGLLLFAISGVWPPMVAVVSGSMEPHMERGDMIFITEPGRFAPGAGVGDTGVVPHDVATETDYRQFGGYGSVVVYTTPRRTQTGEPPVIHRAQFWVSEGENWYDRTDPSHRGSASNCGELRYCPAPNAGFITKGDANPNYDQVMGISRPVKPEWLIGTARVRIPWLGWVRLIVSGSANVLSIVPATGGQVAGTGAGAAGGGIVAASG